QGYGQMSDTLEMVSQDTSAIHGGFASSIRDSMTVKTEHDSLFCPEGGRLVEVTNHPSKFLFIWSTSDTVLSAIGVPDNFPVRGALGIPDSYVNLIEDVKQQVHESFERVIGKSSQFSSLHELPAIDFNLRS